MRSLIIAVLCFLITLATCLSVWIASWWVLAVSVRYVQDYIMEYEEQIRAFHKEYPDSGFIFVCLLAALMLRTNIVIVRRLLTGPEYRVFEMTSHFIVMFCIMKLITHRPDIVLSFFE